MEINENGRYTYLCSYCCLAYLGLYIPVTAAKSPLPNVPKPAHLTTTPYPT